MTIRDQFLGLCLALVTLLVAGCGASGLRVQAQAATLTIGAHAVAGAAIESARKQALDRVEVEHPTDPEHDAAVDVEAARWHPALVALDAMRDALIAWTQALGAARAAGDGADVLAVLLPLAARAVLLYDDVARLASALGVTIPTLPASVVALVASAGGGR